VSTLANKKLKAARADIEKVLRRHDIAGIVFLHTAPGSSEAFMRLDPSYSKLVGVPPTVRLMSKLADYGGDERRQLEDLAATANMVHSLAVLCAQTAMPLLDLAQTIDTATGAEHTGLGFEPDPQPGVS
jgi:hypothetical protein